MVERVAQGVRQRANPGVELFPRAPVARAEALVDAVGPHGAPLVMVTPDPDVRYVLELVIRRYLVLRDMAVIVVDRGPLRVAVVELPGRVRLKEEVLVDKALHFDISIMNSS